MRFVYNFPPHKGVERGHVMGQARKVLEEAGEALEATADYTHAEYGTAEHASFAYWTAFELMDVIHAAETELRMIEGSLEQSLDEIRDLVEDKNRRRGYYDADLVRADNRRTEEQESTSDC
jgi:phosphoribosyl-ATP pyrophosphohydrolase